MEEECKPTLNTGLRGVTVASTKISNVIGDEGKLIYRGYLVPSLAARVSLKKSSISCFSRSCPTKKNWLPSKSSW